MESSVKITERPELYDWLYDDFAEDIPMYISLAQPHAVVLECGVGTGRIAIPLAESGKTVHGIDDSCEMLRRFRDNLAVQPQAVQDRIQSMKLI